MKNILIVGGAGYIGSHTVNNFEKNGYNCIVIDNLSEGHIEALKVDTFKQIDLFERNKLLKIFELYHIDAVIHFAAYTYVGESVKDPQKYYNNNVSATLNLLSVMLEKNVKNIIFSSTCAVYGIPEYLPLDENHSLKPISPYGKTKLMIESILEDYHKAYGLNYIALRYFNAAGAQPDGSIGESHRIETHLIPLILKTLTKEQDNITIFGNDYNTPDGTCIRDYIHVCDLAEAHRLAMEELFNNAKSGPMNVGTGQGYSVKDVITACEQVTGLQVPVIYGERRDGDPAVLVASNDCAITKLNFRPQYTDIKDIISTAWQWEKNRKF